MSREQAVIWATARQFARMEYLRATNVGMGHEIATARARALITTYVEDCFQSIEVFRDELEPFLASLKN